MSSSKVTYSALAVTLVVSLPWVQFNWRIPLGLGLYFWVVLQWGHFKRRHEVKGPIKGLVVNSV